MTLEENLPRTFLAAQPVGWKTWEPKPPEVGTWPGAAEADVGGAAGVFSRPGAPRHPWVGTEPASRPPGAQPSAHRVHPTWPDGVRAVDTPRPAPHTLLASLSAV